MKVLYHAMSILILSVFLFGLFSLTDLFYTHHLASLLLNVDFVPGFFDVKFRVEICDTYHLYHNDLCCLSSHPGLLRLSSRYSDNHCVIRRYLSFTY